MGASVGMLPPLSMGSIRDGFALRGRGMRRLLQRHRVCFTLSLFYLLQLLLLLALTLFELVIGLCHLACFLREVGSP